MKNLRSMIPIILILLSSSFFFGGCQEKSINNSESFLTILDSRGVEVSISEPPQRVISLGPNITEIIFGIGRGDLLVGRTDYCNYPPASIKNIPTVGDIMEPNLEIIVELNPDLIFASTHVSKKTINRLEQMGLCVVALENSEDFEGLQKLIMDCSNILNADQDIVDNLLSEIDRVLKEVSLSSQKISPKPTVYFALGYGKGGDWTAGADTFIDDMITLAGGVNIVKNSGWSYSKEFLVENDPDIILIGRGRKDEFTHLPVYRSLTASKTGMVFEIDEDIITRTSPRSIKGLSEIQNILRRFQVQQNARSTN